MGYGEPGWQWDTQEQVDMFQEYLEETEELQDRNRNGAALGYDETEWEAFCYGWNAARKHFQKFADSAIGNEMVGEYYIGLRDVEDTYHICRDIAGEVVYIEGLDEARAYARNQLDSVYILATIIHSGSGEVVDSIK